jgi:hypothetical protein
MDYAQAVAQHLAWKQRLRRILFGRERRRQPGRTEAIEVHQCPLEQWLCANAERFARDPHFQRAQELHRQSHELAIQMVLSDEETKHSMDQVFQTGQFHICSGSLLEALESLRRNHALSEVPLCEIPALFPRTPAPDAPVYGWCPRPPGGRGP